MHLDLAEDRVTFSELLTELAIPVSIAETADEAAALADNVPLLIRPSYVLGGQGMKIVTIKNRGTRH
jgi:carbamoyl-phosphate synthase large subunit